jgi:hypothetical protein
VRGINTEIRVLLPMSVMLVAGRIERSNLNTAR